MDDVGTDALMTNQWARMRLRRLPAEPSSEWFTKEGEVALRKSYRFDVVASD